MEAFLEIQRQIYQFVAFTQTGVADSKLLGFNERESLLLYVRVTGGSSTLETDLGETLKKALPAMLRKLSGKQATILLLTLIIVFGAAWAFPAWLETQKAIQLETLRNKEHIATLSALSFAKAEQVEAFNKLMATLEAQGKVGERALIMLEQSNDALLKAVSKSKTVEINGLAISGGDAQLLRTSPRKAPTERLSIERVRVVSVSTENDADLQMVLMDEKNDQHRVSIAESLFARQERPLIFEALEKRNPVWAELLFKEVDGEVRSVTFLRLSPDPTSKN